MVRVMGSSKWVKESVVKTKQSAYEMTKTSRLLGFILLIDIITFMIVPAYSQIRLNNDVLVASSPARRTAGSIANINNMDKRQLTPQNAQIMEDSALRGHDSSSSSNNSDLSGQAGLLEILVQPAEEEEEENRFELAVEEGFELPLEEGFELPLEEGAELAIEEGAELTAEPIEPRQLVADSPLAESQQLTESRELVEVEAIDDIVDEQIVDIVRQPVKNRKAEPGLHVEERRSKLNRSEYGGEQKLRDESRGRGFIQPLNRNEDRAQKIDDSRVHRRRNNNYNNINADDGGDDNNNVQRPKMDVFGSIKRQQHRDKPSTGRLESHDDWLPPPADPLDLLRLLLEDDDADENNNNNNSNGLNDDKLDSVQQLTKQVAKHETKLRQLGDLLSSLLGQPTNNNNNNNNRRAANNQVNIVNDMLSRVVDSASNIAGAILPGANTNTNRRMAQQASNGVVGNALNMAGDIVGRVVDNSRVGNIFGLQ